MICNADEYAKTGRHHHIATLIAGRTFEGVYLVAEPPKTACIEGDTWLSFTASDLTGSIDCIVDPAKAGWVEGDRFSSFRVLLRGQVTHFQGQRQARISELHQVIMQW
ncbi:hypothetical protein ALQ08_200228 [Pseudomonas syringae pv. delphinii]|jgi:hypothetical protein|uniref:Uncharacterized protein n=1 Tax=Pseudomonas syringae pv. delphinii TaxID=192088 RepID=A0A3M4JVF0_9PSED|nr:hypothetical protein [Pseudomonas putida]RMQ20854.1 hypothetical protein ALQ08_200228 [Pseudomonas syringae pv. delphinii]